MPLSQFYCLLERRCGMSQDRVSLPGRRLAAEKRERSDIAATSPAPAGTTSTGDAEAK